MEFGDNFEEFIARAIGLANPLNLPSIDILRKEIGAYNDLLHALQQLQESVEIMDSNTDPALRAEIRIGEKVFYWQTAAIYKEVVTERDKLVEKVQAQMKILDRMAAASGRMKASEVHPDLTAGPTGKDRKE